MKPTWSDWVCLVQKRHSGSMAIINLAKGCQGWNCRRSKSRLYSERQLHSMQIRIWSFSIRHGSASTYRCRLFHSRICCRQLNIYNRPPNPIRLLEKVTFYFIAFHIAPSFTYFFRKNYFEKWCSSFDPIPTWCKFFLSPIMIAAHKIQHREDLSIKMEINSGRRSFYISPLERIPISE